VVSESASGDIGAWTGPALAAVLPPDPLAGPIGALEISAGPDAVPFFAVSLAVPPVVVAADADAAAAAAAGVDMGGGEGLPDAGNDAPAGPPPWALLGAGFGAGLGAASFRAAAKAWPPAPGPVE
jgi:hypothetical protein